MELIVFQGLNLYNDLSNIFVLIKLYQTNQKLLSSHIVNLLL